MATGRNQGGLNQDGQENVTIRSKKKGWLSLCRASSGTKQLKISLDILPS
jgi:hypothetical protein